MSVNYGSKRTTVGARYGLRDWMVQRATAALMALFFVIVVVRLLLVSGPVGYEQWAGLFANRPMKALTFVLIVSLAWHAWVGMRDIWMDYIKPVGLRLTLHVLTLAWLAGCAGWAVQVLWRL